MTPADFAADINAGPTDWMRRLIYADWLEDRADPRAELIRIAHRAGLAADSISAMSPRRDEVFSLLLDEFCRRLAAIDRVCGGATESLRFGDRCKVAVEASYCRLDARFGPVEFRLPSGAAAIAHRYGENEGRVVASNGGRIQWTYTPIPGRSLSLPLLAAWCDEQQNGYAAAVRLWDVDY